ncbi:MAG: CHAT domain-containing protein [Saprospirales bacterium]|nr:CHAT domain-containing protein [Saprospirales bacterium]
MRSVILVLACTLPYFLSGQIVDTAAVNRQADSLVTISKNLTGQKDFDSALEINAIAENLALDNLGSLSDAYGYTCFNHGRVLHLKGDFQEAESWYLKALNIYKNLPGEVLPGYAKCLNNLALLYRATDEYDKAESHYREVLAFQKKIGEHTAPDYASCMHSMGILLSDMCRYEHAERLYLDALGQYEKTLGKESSQYARCLNGLAILYEDAGNYEKAEPIYLATIEIQEKSLGTGHWEYALSLHNLASLYLEMGNYEKAEPLYQTAKTIWEKELGKEDPYYAMCLDNIAILHYFTLDYDQAAQYYTEALDLREATVGTTHPDYALNLSHLGLLYIRQGNYEKAESLLLKAVSIYEKSLGKSHREYALSMNNLANLYVEMGLYQKAEPLYLEGFGIIEKTLGTGHPEYLTGLQSLADLYARMGKAEQAVNYFIQASALQQSLLARAVRHLSEQELNRYQVQFNLSQAKMLTFAAQLDGTGSSLSGACYDDALFHKGFLLYASNQVNTLALSNQTSAEKYDLLKSYEKRLATEYTKPAAERKDVTQLEDKANALEKDLAATVAGYGEALHQVNWKDVQQKLGPGEAAIEFVHYRYFFKKETDSTLYAALLLKPGMAQPQLIPLFEEKALDKLLQTRGERRADYVNNLYTIPDRGLQPVGANSAPQTLYELLWQPLEKALAGSQTVYFSPTGLLHRLNIGAIPIPPLDENQWDAPQTVADQYRLIEMGSTRQLVLPSNFSIASQDALLYGGVQYDLDSTSILLADPPIASRSNRDNVATWNYLRWTDKEVTALGPILAKGGIQPTTLKGYEATEESFKALGHSQPSPCILHLATHGFFFPDPKKADGGRQTADREPVFKLSDHPMIRSGLILSGGNYAWSGDADLLRPREEDGILTAYEISQQNLSHTELVVLSACETGLGDIQGNEGVYGLQRAFKIAGAKYLIMSLWQVPDQETATFMVAFYRNWLEEKMPIPDAFRAAQKAMRERFINPYSWAGFVLVE